MTVLLTPVDLSTAAVAGPRLFRKQLLRKGTIQYPGADGRSRTVVFDDDYVARLEAAFKDGAYDDVPFVLADEQNRHTMAPERFHGWLKGVERTPDGIDGFIELSAEAAALVERTGRKLGVSCRIKPVQHVDGRTYDLAINHVLGTLDARLQGPTMGLNPWEPVDLSDPHDDVLDLSGAHYTEGRPMPRYLNLESLTPDQLDAITSVAALEGIDLSEPDDEPAPDGVPDDDEPDLGDEPDDEPDETDADSTEITDAELDALIDAELAATGGGISLSAEPDDTAGLYDGVTLDLSTWDADGTDPESLDLSAAEYAAAGDALQVETRKAAGLRAQLAGREYVAAGVPPHLVDLAAPVLALEDTDTDTLDLASPLSGRPVDVRAIVTGLLDAARGTLDLSREDGHGIESDDEPSDAATAAWIAHLENN